MDSTTVSSNSSPEDSIPGSRSLLLRVRRSNIAHVVHPVLRERLRGRDRETSAQSFVGNCVEGVVIAVGEDVVDFRVDDNVVGFISPLAWEEGSGFLSSSVGGLTQVCTLRDHEAATVDSASLPTCAVAVLPHLIKSFTALHYQARLCAGESILVTDAGTVAGQVLVQLASVWGVKVLAICRSNDVERRLESLRPRPPRVIRSGHAPRVDGPSFVQERVLKETSGIGVDCVVDFSPLETEANEDLVLFERNSRNDYESEQTTTLQKRDIIGCLGTGGRWITEDPNLQLDPPDSEALFLKGASLSFLFDHWLLSSSQVGRFQHILKNALELIEGGLVRIDVETLKTVEDVYRVLKEGKDDKKCYVYTSMEA